MKQMKVKPCHVCYWHMCYECQLIFDMTKLFSYLMHFNDNAVELCCEMIVLVRCSQLKCENRNPTFAYLRVLPLLKGQEREKQFNQ